MTLRELLRYEIWSKRTTWKIFVFTAIVLVLGFALWDGYERYWITRGLRESCRGTLIEIDELHKLSTSCDGNFETKAKRVERELKIADQKEHTFRDIDLLFQLTNYFEDARVTHWRACKQEAFGAIEKGHEPLRELDDRMLSSETEMKQRLHKELD
jgi:hypothetical protein